MPNNVKAGNGSTNVVSGANAGAGGAAGGGAIAAAKYTSPGGLSFVSSSHGPAAAAANSPPPQPKSRQRLRTWPIWLKESPFDNKKGNAAESKLDSSVKPKIAMTQTSNNPKL